MAERTWIEQVVERVVNQVLETHVPRLREDLVQRVMGELQPELQSSGGGERGAKPAELLRAISEIHAGTSQKDILRALLDGCARCCGRAALFVVKGGIATGWQGRGFGDGDTVKDFVLDVSSGLVSQALEERAAVTGPTAEMDRRFTERFGGPSTPEVTVLPLMLKDKVAALLYADAGNEGKLDSPALELLVVSTSAWLEVISLRKQSQKEGGSEGASHIPPSPIPLVQSVPAQSFNDPFAGHAPLHAASAAAPATAREAYVVEPDPVEEVAVAEAKTEPAIATETTPAGLSAEDQDVHRKAQRFAKLLVDEIKLYNQAKVSDGRKNRDVYDRLKDDIEKSRATFNKRYGNTAAVSGNYFSNEVVRSLAEDDITLMGANFRR
jgi:hypothetical protein